MSCTNVNWPSQWWQNETKRDTLFPWHTEHKPLWKALTGTPKQTHSPLFCRRQMLLQMQTHRCPMEGEDHFHEHAGSTTANTAQSAEAAFAVGVTAGSCYTWLTPGLSGPFLQSSFQAVSPHLALHHDVIPFQLQCFAFCFVEIPKIFSCLFPQPLKCHLPALPSSRSTAPQKRDGGNKTSSLTTMCFPDQGLTLMAMCLCCSKHCR